jgi:hypothetical protein
MCCTFCVLYHITVYITDIKVPTYISQYPGNVWNLNMNHRTRVSTSWQYILEWHTRHVEQLCSTEHQFLTFTVFVLFLTEYHYRRQLQRLRNSNLRFVEIIGYDPWDKCDVRVFRIIGYQDIKENCYTKIGATWEVHKIHACTSINLIIIMYLSKEDICQLRG